jgi:hypothetical protein
LEVESIEAQQVEGTHAQEIVPAEVEEVGRECLMLVPWLETGCAELGSVGDAQTVTARGHWKYHRRKMLAEKPDQSRRVVGRLGIVHSQIEEVPDEL